MSVSQIPLQGSVAYEKVVYVTNEKRSIDIHYLGDHHDKQTKCVDKKAMNTISLLQNSLNAPHVLPIDVFVEIGIGVDGKDRNTYLNELVVGFQKEHCLKKGLKERTQCDKKYPDVRFHCVDFRHTLYMEYMEIIDQWWFNEGGHNTRDMNHLLQTIYGYVSYLVNNDSSTLPYKTEFQNDREMQRLGFVYDMVVYREKRYSGRPRLPFAPTLSEFMGDLYYLMCSSPSTHDVFPIVMSPIHVFYPRHIQLNPRPYYMYRLIHEYNHVPEVINRLDVRSKFEIATKDRLDIIGKSSNPKQIELDTRLNESHVNIIAATHLSWLMDMYVCFRSLKSYISHVVIVLGVDHIQQMKRFMQDLGIKFISSELFSNPGIGLVHGAQCISIPVDTSSNPRLTFDNNVFPNMIPYLPEYYGKLHRWFRNRKLRHWSKTRKQSRYKKAK